MILFQLMVFGFVVSALASHKHEKKTEVRRCIKILEQYLKEPSLAVSSFQLKAFVELNEETFSTVQKTKEKVTKLKSDDSFCENKRNGEYADPKSCEGWIDCIDKKAFNGKCAPPLLYDQITKHCDYEGNVHCGDRYIDHGVTCYGAKNSSFGVITMQQTGLLTDLKLVHKSGYLHCDKTNYNYRSLWGCNKPILGNRRFGTLITTEDKQIIFPDESINHDMNWWYGMLGYNVNSAELTMVMKQHLVVSKLSSVQIWYNEDLLKVSEQDNDGIHCVNVYAKIKKSTN